jgi:stearoyl-CoA desaturase (delta-9 desaturase)
MRSAIDLPPDERPNWVGSFPFVLLQFSPLLILFTGIGWKSVALCAAMYVTRMWFITAGYHRYFSHRAFTTNRVFQFVLAFGGGAAAQKGALWWASHHRSHHRHTETEQDPHTPLKGLLQSHIGWIVTERWSPTDWDAIADFAKYPELRFLNKHDWIAPWSFGVAAFLIDGWRGLVVGFLTSTVLLWHATFCVNSLAHVMGRRRYATADTSRNSWFVALITGGEGWHNNHHHYPPAARNGFFWWEWDPTYYVLRVLSWFGVVRDLRMPNDKVLAGPRVREGALDVGILRAHVMRASGVTARSRKAAGELAAHGLEEVEAALSGSIESAKAAARGARRRVLPDPAPDTP